MRPGILMRWIIVPLLVVVPQAAAARGQVRAFPGHRGAVLDVTFSADGRRALSRDVLAVRLWGLETGQAVRTFQGHQGAVVGMAVSKDWRRLVTAGQVDDRQAAHGDAAGPVDVSAEIVRAAMPRQITHRRQRAARRRAAVESVEAVNAAHNGTPAQVLPTSASIAPAAGMSASPDSRRALRPRAPVLRR